MTEAEWLACEEPQRMLTVVGEMASSRKLRLFAVACCRRVWPLLLDPRCREAVGIAELQADDEGEDERLERTNADAALAAQDGSSGKTAQNSCAAWASERATRFARARPGDIDECVANAAWA